MKLTNDEIQAIAKAAYTRAFKPTGNGVLDLALEHIYLRGFAEGGEFASSVILKRACDDLANNAVTRIMGESK